MNAKKRARTRALAVVMLLGLVPSCRDEPRPAPSPPPAAVSAPAPAQARTIPTRPLPEAWTAGKGFPADFRLEFSTSWEWARNTTVLEAGADATGTIVVNDTDNNGDGWECRYTIGQADLAMFRWSELMAFMERRRREGIVVPPALPPVTDLPSQSISLRAFGVVADLEIFREYDAIDEVRLHVFAVTRGAWQWHAIWDPRTNLKGELEQCYGGTLPQRDDVEGMRRLNARVRAAPLEARIAIDAGQGRARALRIKGAEASKEERRCMENVIDRVRLPIPSQPTCNPIWTLLLQPRPSSWLPIQHRTE